MLKSSLACDASCYTASHTFTTLIVINTQQLEVDCTLQRTITSAIFVPLMSNSGSTESTPKIPPNPPPTSNRSSDTSNSSPVILPTPSMISESDQVSLESHSKTGSSSDQVEVQNAETTNKAEPGTELVPPPPPPPPPELMEEKSKGTKSAKKTKVSKDKGRNKTKKTRKRQEPEESSTSESSDADSESEDSDDERKEKERRKKRRKAAAKKAAAKKKAAKERAKRKSKKQTKNTDSSDENTGHDSDESSAANTSPMSDSNSDSDDGKKQKGRRKTAKARAKAKKGTKKNRTITDSSDSESDSTSISSSASSSSSSDSDSDYKRAKSKRKRTPRKSKTKKAVDDDGSVSDGPVTVTTTDGSAPPVPGDDLDTQVTKVNAILQNLKMQQLAAAQAAAGILPPTLKLPVKKNAHEFKRVDQVWDTKLRDYKLIESTADQKDEFECVFTVRRRFNWEGKLRDTLVDIKSKALRGVLQVVLRECKCISLVEDIPEIDPHVLYHYYDEIRKYMKKTLKPKLRRAKRSKDQKQLTQEIAQCKLLLGYIDEDFTATRNALKLLLKAGTITYELCWALFKPNTIVYTPTYGNKEDPRCFKVEQCFEYESWLSGAKSCCIDGKYLEYDGQVFGFGDHQAEIKAFKGHKKITSLVAYPLIYHKDPKVRICWPHRSTLIP